MSGKRYPEEFKIEAVKQVIGNAMLLALVTGQRLGDISNMKFTDV